MCVHSNACMYVCVKAYCFYLSVREQSCVCVCVCKVSKQWYYILNNISSHIFSKHV